MKIDETSPEGVKTEEVDLLEAARDFGGTKVKESVPGDPQVQEIK